MRERWLEDSMELTLRGVLGRGGKSNAYHPQCLVKSCWNENTADELHTLKRDCSGTRENVHYRYPEFDERVYKA